MKEMSGIFLSIYILIFLVFIFINLEGKKPASGLLYIYTILDTEFNFKAPTE